MLLPLSVKSNVYLIFNILYETQYNTTAVLLRVYAAAAYFIVNNINVHCRLDTEYTNRISSNLEMKGE